MIEKDILNYLLQWYKVTTVPTPTRIYHLKRSVQLKFEKNIKIV